MAPAFPGGISDNNGAVAYLNVAGALVAIDLRSGAVKWRRSDAVEPIAASDRFLVTRRNQPGEPVIEVRDAQTGDPVAALTAAQLPGFSGVEPGDPIEADVEDAPGGAQIRWRSERRYRGGAVPRGLVADTTAAHGAVLLNAATGETQSVTSFAAPAARVAPQPVPGDSATISAVRDGDVLFALKQRDRGLLLEARTAGGELLWQTALGTAGAPRTGPLRE
ncbi:MAG TPA: hypothetical protein VF079_04245 [Sphingomicrobium sp.]